MLIVCWKWARYFYTASCSRTYAHLRPAHSLKEAYNPQPGCHYMKTITTECDKTKSLYFRSIPKKCLHASVTYKYVYSTVICKRFRVGNERFCFIVVCLANHIIAWIIQIYFKPSTKRKTVGMYFSKKFSLFLRLSNALQFKTLNLMLRYVESFLCWNADEFLYCNVPYTFLMYKPKPNETKIYRKKGTGKCPICFWYNT